MRFAEDGMYVIISINSSHPNLIKIAKELFPIFMFTYLFFQVCSEYLQKDDIDMLLSIGH